MPLRAAQLFVRCGSLEELRDALGRALRRAPAAGRACLALHEGGWGTLVLRQPDPQLARLLSERFGAALQVHLDGGALALSVQDWQSGAPGEEDRDPRPPHFRDVELVLWELLQYLGVPPALRILELDGVEVLGEGAGAGLPAVLARGVELHGACALPPPRDEGPLPPVQPDLVVESKAGEARALEVRQLPGGIPTEAWAEALAEIEQAQALRLLRALSDDDAPRVPRPAFAWRSLQPLRVEKLLASARSRRPWLARLYDPERPPPLSLAGFNRLCRARLADADVARAHGAHLELRDGDACVRAPVRQAYQAYLATLDEDAAAAGLAQQARALLGAPPRALSAGQLLPTLLAGEPGPRAARPLAAGLQAALLRDDGERIAPVLARELPALGLDLEAAFARAVANADALTEASPQAIRWLDLEHGRVAFCEFSDAGGAGRLLSPRARALLLEVLGEGRAVAAAPTRDALLACAASDAGGVAWLREEAARRFAEGPYPIHPGLWVLGADLLRPVADVAPGASTGGGDLTS